MRGIRLTGVVVAAGLAVGATAISLPTTASSAATRHVATSHLAKHYSLNQLLSGVLFDVGPVGQLMVGGQTTTALTANESKALKSFETALGAAKGQAIVTGLQSGNITEFAQAVNMIDANVSSLATAPVSGGKAIVAARAALARSGDLGVACSATSGPHAAGCAQSPTAVSPNAGKATSQSVAVAIYKNRMAIAVYDSNYFFVGSASGTVAAGTPNSVAVQKQEVRLVTLLHA